MKLMSVVIPCYNSAPYVEKCIKSLLVAKEELEIILINDGSTDDGKTAEILEKYQQEYPADIKVIHQVNKGHGGALNTGLQVAKGRYFKVLDSDDWFDENSLLKILIVLRSFELKKEWPDVVVANYVYENQAKKKKKLVHFRGSFPQHRISTWDELGYFRKGHYLLMHTLIYEREFLLSTGLKLPEHTFYVDNLFAFIPLQSATTFYYVNVPLYRYFIGRADQSVQENNMVKRLDQQLLITQLLLDSFTEKLPTLNEKQKKYFFNYFEIMMAISSILLMLKNTAEDDLKIKLLWSEVAQKNKWLYRKLRLGLIGMIAFLPKPFNKKIALSVYRVARNVFGFN